MRYSEFSVLPGTPEEAKSLIVDLLTLYLGNNKSEVPLKLVLSTLRHHGFDIDRRLAIDLIKNEPIVNRVHGKNIYLNNEPEEDVASKDETELSKQKVKDMAKKTIKKKVAK